MTLEEVREVTNIARRISAILRLEPELDKYYAAVKAVAEGGVCPKLWV